MRTRECAKDNSCSLLRLHQVRAQNANMPRWYFYFAAEACSRFPLALLAYPVGPCEIKVPLISMLSRKVHPLKSGPVSTPSSKTMEMLLTVSVGRIGGKAVAGL